MGLRRYTTAIEVIELATHWVSLYLFSDQLRATRLNLTAWSYYLLSLSHQDNI